MQVHSYLNFNGRTDEALAFYQKAAGARVGMLMRFKDAPPQPGMPDFPPERVMHCDFTIGATVLMATDGMEAPHEGFKGFSLSIAADSDAEAEKLFAALSEGGKVTMPMGPSFFASRFGMLQDRFGVEWMVVRSVPPTGQAG